MSIASQKNKQTRSGSVSPRSSVGEEAAFMLPLSKLAPAKLHAELQPLKLSITSLQKNGYPFLHQSGKSAVFLATENNFHDWAPANDRFRQCVRCWKKLWLNANGSMNAETCVFHHSPKWNPQTYRKMHTCCNQQPGTSRGCMAAPRHVFKTAREDTLLEFIKTPKPNASTDFRSKRVYALDVELVYTLNGMETARVSMVDMKGRTIIDNFVLPQAPILDFNYEFSGIEEKHMTDAISLEACRLQMFQFVNEETILVGHSLEADLKALRLVHHNIIDTAILFGVTTPERFYKKALRHLASEYLGKNIQDSASGHCSAEDAATCMQLLEHVPRGFHCPVY